MTSTEKISSRSWADAHDMRLEKSGYSLHHDRYGYSSYSIWALIADVYVAMRFAHVCKKHFKLCHTNPLRLFFRILQAAFIVFSSQSLHSLESLETYHERTTPIIPGVTSMNKQIIKQRKPKKRSYTKNFTQ